MKRIRLLLSLLFLAAIFAYNTVPASAQATRVPGVKAGVIEATPINKAATYCHLKFPAISEETLGSANPVLKDPGSGDIIDFYGPCDHDPVGYDEVCAQRARQLEGFCD